jgi:hypothetical protein
MPAELRRTVHIVYLRVFLPDRPERTAGVFVLDDATGNLYFRMREDWPEIADPDDAEVLGEMGADFRRRVEALDDGGGAEFLASLEDQLSNVVRLSERETVEIDDIRSTLDRLFEECCRS